ncbi:MAG: DNA-3-methyladenine glycosylase [Chloroflexota bacterium]
MIAADVAETSPASPLPDRAWFDRPALAVARGLLGARLVHDAPAGRVAGTIVEVEAYTGPEDLAAHSSRGMTPRNRVMFGEPGHVYVYLVYGLHHCANVVCGPGGKPEAVLLRAAAIDEGIEIARQRRGSVADARLAAGPGNLGRAFGLDRSHDGLDLLASPVRIELGTRIGTVRRGPRIGVDYAGEWAARPYRLWTDGDPHVSR